jgi:flagellar biosynthesis protein FlhG
VAIGGGKGGVGKSLVAANVGIFLATLGKRVVLVDGALGASNLHIFAGIPRPSRSLYEALRPSSPASLTELAVPTHVPGVRLVGGVYDPPWVSSVTLDQVRGLAEQVRALPADWVVIDLAPGLGAATLELFLEADISLLVAVPDPTSIELMHRFVRAAFLARLSRLGLSHLSDIPGWEPREHEGGMPSALDIYLAAVGARAPEVEALREAILGFAPHLVINSARSKSDMELGRAVASAARRRLGTPIRYLGHLEYDEAVWASTRRRRPLLIEHPETRIAKCFERVARGLLAVRSSASGGLETEVLPSDSHYELLEVPPTASFEDIRRANRRIRDVYGAESIAVSGLYDPASLEAVHRRLDLSYTTLMDAAKRKEYDLELFPDGVPMPLATPSDAAPPPRPPAKGDDPATLTTRPPMPQLDARTEYSGPLLRQIREAVGVELREIAERSKIGMAYLQALEGEVWSKLPAPVYVRGFLAEYARALGLDPERVKQTYLDRYRAARGPQLEADDEAAKP